MKKTDLRRIEASCMVLMGHNLGVGATEYTAYYSDLKQLFLAMGFSESEWQFRPLSVLQAIRMTALCERSESKCKKTSLDRSFSRVVLTAPKLDKELKSYEAKLDPPQVIHTPESNNPINSPKAVGTSDVACRSSILSIVLRALCLTQPKIFP
jgi:hypothetical protein